MKINTDITIELTAEDLTSLIKNKLNAEGYEVLEISFPVKKHRWTDGYGTMEIDHEELQFLGAIVKVKANKGVGHNN